MGSPSIGEYAYYQENEKTSYFITDDGRRYSVTFEEQPFFEDHEFILANHTYEVFLTLQKAPPAYSTDPRIGATVTGIIQNFIEKDPLRIVFFTCDTADGRHHARFKRFNDWFRENNNRRYLKLEDSIDYPAINKLFLIALIMRNDHPYGGEVLASFVKLNAQLRSRK
ncbi:DUF6169 family protein [Spirosoma foliorum]|uniref:Uncharacterized protein n=1 Tax=Spirosoma foliorum TaxID=2710596 RepID=A0A7G5H4Q7_9BACT|nr:DUF6169 family protein [Spirosoma foliorum]QMW06099.1 hypothetical protein H3H32_14985 [Spirosoma foliorum]